MFRLFLLSFVMLGSPFLAKTQNISQALDSFIRGQYQAYHLSGNVLVVQNDSIIYEHSFGFANSSTNSRNTPSSAFHLASLSKPFTAVAVLQQWEKHRLKLDDPVSTYPPQFPFPKITIRQLLSHTSGLGGFEIFEQLHRKDSNRIFTNADIIPALLAAEKPTLFEPGSGWSYSNIGYGLLAMLVEKTSGMAFREYLRRYIFSPAKMRHTYIQTQLLPVTDNNRTINYDYQSYSPAILNPADSFQRNKVPMHTLGNFIGPGNVVSTTGDLLLFDKALYGHRLLSPATLQEAFTPVRLSNGDIPITGWANGRSYYGLGWMILCDSSAGKVVWHSGGAPGMVTAFLRNISRRQTVILLDNVTHRGLHGIAVNTLAMLNQQPVFVEKTSLAHLYAAELFTNGIDHAAAVFNVLKSDTAHYFLEEGAMNICGLELMWDGHYPLAAEVLKLNTLLFPNAWNTYDSYGKVLWLMGKKSDAAAMYEKSIQLNPGNQGGKEMLEKIKSGTQ